MTANRLLWLHKVDTMTSNLKSSTSVTAIKLLLNLFRNSALLESIPNLLLDSNDVSATLIIFKNIYIDFHHWNLYMKTYPFLSKFESDDKTLCWTLIMVVIQNSPSPTSQCEHFIYTGNCHTSLVFCQGLGKALSVPVSNVATSYEVFLNLSHPEHII